MNSVLLQGASLNRRPNNQQGSSSGNNERHRGRRRRGGGGGNQGGRGGESPTRQIEPHSHSAGVEAVSRKAPPVLKRYGVVFYETHAQAREDAENLEIKAKEVDQLNIVVRAEGTMEDPELLKYGKLFAGEAWHLIHRRRVDDDKWYNEPHE